MSSVRRGDIAARFINDLYAIVIAVGVAFIVSDDEGIIAEISTSDGWKGLSALLVLGAGLLHWWDWVKAVSTHVEDDPVEVLLDITIVLSFVFFFTHYDNPEILAVLFCGLALLDLVWVINFQRMAQRTRENLGIRLRWLGRKAAALALYVAAATFILVWDCTIPPVLPVSWSDTSILALIFIIVRLTCFKNDITRC